jgi:dTMP kinase
MKREGLFVSFEGNEGAGKTTQSVLLAKKLRADGYEVVVVREPGSTKLGERIRELILSKDSGEMTFETEALLLAAARAQAVGEIYIPALESGAIILADRYVDSSYAYQGYGRELGLAKVKEINEFAISKLMPDLTILLELDFEIGLQRRHKTDKIDRMDMQEKSFYDRTEAGYTELAKLYPKRIKTIDALLSIEEIEAKIYKQVSAVLASRKNNITGTR